MKRRIYVFINGRLNNADQTENNEKIWTEFKRHLIRILKI